MSIDNIRTQLKQLRLSGASTALDLRLQEARANCLDHAQFLEILMQDELLNRSNNKMKAALRLAYSGLKPLSDFDWQFNPNLDRRAFTNSPGDFVRKGTNVLFVGPSGTEQTCLAQAIGYEG